VINDYQLWVMVVPAIAVIVIFNYIPIYGVQLAFREFSFQKGITGGAWVGLKYFEQFFKNPMFFKVIRNTFTLSGLNILFGFPTSIVMAILFNQVSSGRIKKTLQTTVYIPNFISTVVIVAMINLFLSPNTGAIDTLMKKAGLIGEHVNIMAKASNFPLTYVFSEVWQRCGWNSIIYLAALSNIDPGLYDAAKIDGANRLRIIWHIDLVALTPTAIMMLILTMGSLLSVGFEKVFLMQNAINQQLSEVITTYTYKIGIERSQFSYSSAIGLFNTLVNFVFLILTNVLARRNGYNIF
jgi:putative aldouronate transport system permease protein